MSLVTENVGLMSYQISLSINRGQRAFNDLLSLCLKHNDLTVPQWSVLGQLYTRGALRPHSIAQHIGVKPPFASTVLQQLSEQGFIEAVICPDDERGKELKLTPSGHAKVETVEKKLVICIDQQLGEIETEDLQKFFSVSNYMAQKVRHH